MMTAVLKREIESVLGVVAGSKVIISEVVAVGGGCINNTCYIETTEGRFFVKWNKAAAFPGMFEAEEKGLMLLSRSNTMRIPQTITTGDSGEDAFLIMEYIESSSPARNFWEIMGQQLADVHNSSSDVFGLNHDNYIGSLPQSNKQHKNWTDFFRDERLIPQVNLALQSGRISRTTADQFSLLYRELSSLFPNEKPALLHGDLWSGNFMSDEKGLPCLIDPAVYYGFREMDIAMTKLFGGFDDGFYDAYNEASPLQSGWQNRVELCNLYPLMVHVNLFGGGYAAQVERILGRFIL